MGTRIGCYSAFWGDTPVSARQFFDMRNPPNYVVADYLAEVTMGILARSKAGGKAGYVKEFLDHVYVPNARKIAEKGITIVTNAGGLDPAALKEAIEAAASEAGISPAPIVAAVYGDDLASGAGKEKLERLVRNGDVRQFSHIRDGKDAEVWPSSKAKVMSVNAYMGCQAIVRALQEGATIIVTGRVVDSALVLGPLIHEYAWKFDDFNLLAGGSLAGHIIECGCQCTGGNFTDWRLSAHSKNGGWANMGYPIVEVFRDGTFLVTKPPSTGGIVTVGTVAEQMIYEVLDPGSYLLPDVTVDIRNVQIEEVAENVVRVVGAIGRPPSPFLKTSGVFVDGYKMSAELLIGGLEAAEKAREVGHAILTRVRGLLKQFEQADFRAHEIECIGAEHTFGPNGNGDESREVMLRLTVQHDSKMALMLFARETAPSATCMAPGITGGGSGRPSPSPNLAHFSGLVPKDLFPATVLVGPASLKIEVPYIGSCVENADIAPQLPAMTDSPIDETELIYARLIDICYGRSGDKGDTCNIGIICRKPEFFPFLAKSLTSEVVKNFMGHLVLGDIVRFELPGTYALNFVCTRALGGGGLSSLRIDRQGKTYAQMLLSFKMLMPRNFFSPPPSKI